MGLVALVWLRLAVGCIEPYELPSGVYREVKTEGHGRHPEIGLPIIATPSSPLSAPRSPTPPQAHSAFSARRSDVL